MTTEQSNTASPKATTSVEPATQPTAKHLTDVAESYSQRAEQNSAVELKDAVRAFAANARNVARVLHLPGSFAAAASRITMQSAMRGFADALYEDRGKSDSTFNELISKTSGFELYVARESIAEGIRRDVHVERAVTALWHLTVASAWTVFECCSADCWEASLNARPKSLARRAFGSQPDDDDGITRKMVMVDVLAQHDFDLRSKLGTILRSKFDFTSVKGCRDAYRAALGKMEELETAFETAGLFKLECTRNLVVHRAGLVDEKYKKQTNSTAKVGTTLPLDLKEADLMIESAFNASCQLIEFLNGWLIKNAS